MTRALVSVHGYIGDTFFASSVVDRLKEDGKFDEVDLEIMLHQPRFLLDANPSVDAVIVGLGSSPRHLYDKVFTLGQVDQSEPATIQFQKQAGIDHPSLGYRVFIPEFYSSYGLKFVEDIKRNDPTKKIVGYQANWIEKSFLFNEDQYWNGIDIPYKGYGGELRNIDFILDNLAREVLLLSIGLPAGVSQYDVPDPDLYSHHAGILNHCDYMIGGEGGLTNLSAGLGVPTIITTDFIWQLYGPRGSQKHIDNPKMGPCTYFPNQGHHHLNPFLTDAQVVEQILSIITS